MYWYQQINDHQGSIVEHDNKCYIAYDTKTQRWNIYHKGQVPVGLYYCESKDPVPPATNWKFDEWCSDCVTMDGYRRTYRLREETDGDKCYRHVHCTDYPDCAWSGIRKTKDMKCSLCKNAVVDARERGKWTGINPYNGGVNVVGSAPTLVLDEASPALVEFWKNTLEETCFKCHTKKNFNNQLRHCYVAKDDAGERRECCFQCWYDARKAREAEKAMKKAREAEEAMKKAREAEEATKSRRRLVSNAQSQRIMKRLVAGEAAGYTIAL